MVISFLLIFLKILKMEMLSTSGKIKFKFNRTVQKKHGSVQVGTKCSRNKKKIYIGRGPNEKT